MALSRLPDEEPLADYDPALAERLRRRLQEILCEELGQGFKEAAALTARVRWSVRRERDGLWLNMDGIGVAGTWGSDEDGLDLYVRQLAYELVDRSEDFKP